jgi:RimJ/RimL family protein N-acetyltransferase
MIVGVVGGVDRMKLYLTTDRLLLREFTDDDLVNLVELDRDPEVMRYISGGVPTPRELVQVEVLPRFLRSYEREPGFGVWAVLDKSTSRFIGRMSLELESEEKGRDARLGFRLRRTEWSKGYATEGARALIKKGFLELNLARVSASTYEHNVASRRVMEKCGMRLRRRYRPTLEDLAAHASSNVEMTAIWEGDEVEYAIERGEWDAGKTSESTP